MCHYFSYVMENMFLSQNRIRLNLDSSFDLDLNTYLRAMNSWWHIQDQDIDTTGHPTVQVKPAPADR